MSDKNIDKDIEILKDFIKKDYEPWSFYEKQGDELFELQEAIELVLWYMNDYKNENVVLHNELETYKKIAEKLAEKKVVGCINCTVSCVSDEDIDTYIKNEIDWARKEVENEKE